MGKLTDVSSRYGAPMGRPSAHPGDDPHCHMRVRRVRLDSGGYDEGGAYWGYGTPLWYCSGIDEFDGVKCAIEDFHRAASKAQAIAYWANKFPNAKVW